MQSCKIASEYYTDILLYPMLSYNKKRSKIFNISNVKKVTIIKKSQRRCYINALLCCLNRQVRGFVVYETGTAAPDDGTGHCSWLD